MVNSESSQQVTLDDARLLQRSPLSQILFLFFNIDLVKSIINKNKETIAFIDDYTSWVTGLDIKSNTERLQAEVIPKLKVQANRSGTIFNPEKTVLVYFTQNWKKLNIKVAMPLFLKLGNQLIYEQKEVKLLGIVIYQKLTYKEPVAKVLQKGIKAALGLRRLRNLYPKSAR